MLPAQMLPTTVLLEMHRQRLHNAERHQSLQAQLTSSGPAKHRQPKRRRWFRHR